jgi:hypothetical protein
MPAHPLFRAFALAGACAIATIGFAARADDLQSLLIGLPMPQPVETIDPTDKCVEPDAVMLQFRSEALALGGTALAMDSALDQRFSDEWRRRVHASLVPVGLILVHAFTDPRDNETTVVDTVEFDVDGCAMSRTMMPLGAWSTLVKVAAGTPA